MRRLLPLALCFTGLQVSSPAAEEIFDRISDRLTVSAFDDQVRTRLSGQLDLEGYHFPGNVPGLVNTRYRNFFNPRFTAFLDTQLGPAMYAFVQARVDRSFDGGDHGARIRLDEYSLRASPWDDGRLTISVGKFATIVGNWTERHLSWDNPFINAPLPYEGVTLAADLEAESAELFTRRTVDNTNKYEYLPIVWGPSYATGASVSGKIGQFEYAAEVKNASLGSRPPSWDLADTGFSRPSFHVRAAWRPNAAWRLGISGGQGPYLREEATPELPEGRSLDHYLQRTIAQDVSFAWRHWQVWAEVFQARYEAPYVGNADTLLYYVEAKYKFAPQAFAAVRWNQQWFGDVSDGRGGRAAWGNDQWRIDTSLAYRFTPHTQMKLQYSVDRGRREPGEFSHTVAGQLTIRF